ncbi:MAG: heavy metal translocating P-type ATPase [Chroococcidiopsidaceae cyanobacterium CP_BM_ER_R8_30]|nr:heavy metal translocating P-type ATPase [Chroococcidiopsidaceae cyanobacterium CP_BM_ER_R8_30]
MLVTTGTEAAIDNHREEIGYQVVHTTVGRCRIRIPRLTSDSEYARKLSWLVESFDFVTHVRINPTAGAVVITYDIATLSNVAVQENLLTAIQQASEVEIPLEAISAKTKLTPEIDWWERIGLPLASLGLALLAEQLLLPIPAIVIGGVIAAAALPFFNRLMDTTIRERRLDADILDALWIGIHTFRGDFVAPALMVSLMETGEALRDTTARASERQALNLLDSLDQNVWVEQDGKERRIPLNQVQVGDQVVVYPGNLIPVSGRVLRGTALIDEHKLTGESTLVSRSEGQVVHASTLVLEGKLWILAKRIGSNTRVGVAFQLMQSAPVHDTRVEDYAGQIANAAVLPSLCLGGTIFALTGDAARALAPLQLDFGYGIRLSVPTTILVTLIYAARNGVYIRSGRALEMLARIDAIVFDKTGTLTQGNAAVVAIQTADESIPATVVLTLAASAEQGNTHPIASAITRYAEENGVQTCACETWHYWIGMGIAAQINGQKVFVGSERLMQQEGIDLDHIHRRYPDINSGIHSRAYVAQDGKLLGVILYTDPVRPESKSEIARLRSQSIDTYMLTGDNQRVADEVASQLGIKPSNIYAEAFPERKVEIVRQLHDSGKTVAFVGDGINDSAALAHADVSISFAGAIDLARETADVILMNDNLQDLIYAIDLAKQAMEIVYQNTAIVAIPNISVVLAGVFFALDPILAVIISNGSVLMAELNSFRHILDDRKPWITDVSVTQSPTYTVGNSDRTHNLKSRATATA